MGMNNKKNELLQISETMPSTECWAKVKSELTAKGLLLLPKDVELIMTAKSNRITDNIEQLAVSITQIINVYFGVNYDNISRELVGEVTANLINRFKDLTFDDLRNSFTRKSIQKIKGVGMTVSEFLAPIEEFYKVKQSVTAHVKEAELAEKRKEMERNLAIAQYEQQKKEQLEVFNDLVRKGASEWIGTAEQALMISTKVSVGYVDIEEKKAIFKRVLDQERAKKMLERKRKTKEQEFYEAIEFDNATFSLRAKCALIVVNQVLELKSME